MIFNPVLEQETSLYNTVNARARFHCHQDNGYRSLKSCFSGSMTETIMTFSINQIGISAQTNKPTIKNLLPTVAIHIDSTYKKHHSCTELQTIDAKSFVILQKLVDVF